jgi:hypothetical protein
MALENFFFRNFCNRVPSLKLTVTKSHITNIGCSGKMEKRSTISQFPLTVYCDTLEEVQESIESSEFIRPALLAGCQSLLESDRRTLLIAEILSLDTYATIKIFIRRDEVEDVLRKTLTWFESREEYEECSECLRLIEKSKKWK